MGDTNGRNGVTREGAGRGRGNGYRWECPFCDRAQINRLSATGNSAVQALAQHIRSTDGKGHADVGEVPAPASEEVLRNHVEPSGA